MKAWNIGRARTQALQESKAVWSEAIDPRTGEVGLPCYICNQSIDYTLAYPDEDSCSIEHIKSRYDYPELTWDPANWAPAHLRCNKQKGRKGVVDIGIHTPFPPDGE